MALLANLVACGGSQFRRIGVMFSEAGMAAFAGNSLGCVCDLAHPACVAKQALHRDAPVEIKTGFAVVSGRDIPTFRLGEPRERRLKQTLADADAVAVPHGTRPNHN